MALFLLLWVDLRILVRSWKLALGFSLSFVLMDILGWGRYHVNHRADFCRDPFVYFNWYAAWYLDGKIRPCAICDHAYFGRDADHPNFVYLLPV